MCRAMPFEILMPEPDPNFDLYARPFAYSLFFAETRNLTPETYFILMHIQLRSRESQPVINNFVLKNLGGETPWLKI
jgi:hypothetical protein